MEKELRRRRDNNGSRVTIGQAPNLTQRRWVGPGLSVVAHNRVALTELNEKTVYQCRRD